MRRSNVNSLRLHPSHGPGGIFVGENGCEASGAGRAKNQLPEQARGWLPARCIVTAARLTVASLTAGSQAERLFATVATANTAHLRPTLPRRPTELPVRRTSVAPRKSRRAFELVSRRLLDHW